jgi:hypothetical protein
VAQHGPRPARKYRCHAPAVSAEDTVPDRVHASVHRVKPPALDPVIDRVPTDPEAPELPKRDDPVLPLSEPPDRPIDPPSVGFVPDSRTKYARVAHAAEFARRRRTCGLRV